MCLFRDVTIKHCDRVFQMTSESTSLRSLKPVVNFRIIVYPKHVTSGFSDESLRLERIDEDTSHQIPVTPIELAPPALASSTLTATTVLPALEKPESASEPGGLPVEITPGSVRAPNSPETCKLDANPTSPNAVTPKQRANIVSPIDPIREKDKSTITPMIITVPSKESCPTVRCRKLAPSDTQTRNRFHLVMGFFHDTFASSDSSDVKDIVFLVTISLLCLSFMCIAILPISRHYA